MGLFKDNPVSNTIMGVGQAFAIPILFSAGFCFLVGMPFLTFWGVVYHVLKDFVLMIIGFITDPNFMNYVHQFFRKLIFMS